MDVRTYEAGDYGLEDEIINRDLALKMVGRREEAGRRSAERATDSR